MKNVTNKVQVLWHILTLQSKNCPFCFTQGTKYYGRNSTLSHVRRCPECGLMFRWPKQTDAFNKLFYQRKYIRLAADDVQLPTPDEVKSICDKGFVGHEKFLGYRLEIVKLLNPSSRLAVFGANWGYEVFQFARAGFQAVGYEISEPRASFGSQHLGCRVFHTLSQLKENGPYDVVFSAHVMEHLPSPEPALSLFQSICAPDGLLVLFMPNCDGQSARRQGVWWGPFNSSLHPLSYSASFFTGALPKYGFDQVSTFSEPYDFQKVRSHSSEREPLGDELLVIARKTGGS